MPKATPKPPARPSTPVIPSPIRTALQRCLALQQELLGIKDRITAVEQKILSQVQQLAHYQRQLREAAEDLRVRANTLDLVGGRLSSPEKKGRKA